VQLGPLQGKVDPRRLALTGQKMADSKQIFSNPQTANPLRVLPDGAGRPVPLGDPGFAGGGEGNCPLWDGHIIDATFPPE
jgi:hypothetical protein